MLQPQNWDSSEEGAWPERNQTLSVQVTRCTALYSRKGARVAEIGLGMQETGSNSRKRHRLTGVGPDQTGKAGSNAFDFSTHTAAPQLLTRECYFTEKGGTAH